MDFATFLSPRGSKVVSSLAAGTINNSHPLASANSPVMVAIPSINSCGHRKSAVDGTTFDQPSMPATQLGADPIYTGALNALLNGADREADVGAFEGISKNHGARVGIDPCIDGDHAGVSERRSCQSLGDGVGLSYEDAHIRQLIKSKERELHDIHEFRIRSLEGLLEERDAALAESIVRYDKLKEDFKFNLSLIEDRDAELGRLEATLQELKDCLRDKEVEASELKMSMDEALSGQRQADSREKEQRSYWQAKCKALRDEIDGLRWAREEDCRAAREGSEAARAALTRQLREREDQLEAQRLDAAETFDSLMRQREEESKARESELTFQLREAEARAAEQARQRERAEREVGSLKESSKKVRRALDEEEKATRNLRWELEDRQQMTVAELEEASKKTEAWEEKYHAVAAAGEDRVRDVLESLHAVEKAFVQHKDRHETEEQALKREEEETRKSLEACRVRVSELEEALAEGGKREDGLREVVRAAREEHRREVVALRKKITDGEASYRRELEQANAAATALRDANSSLESVIAGLEEREACLKDENRAQKEGHANAIEQLKRSLESRTKEAENLKGELSRSREEMKRLKRQHEEQKEAFTRAMRDLQAELEDLRRQQQQAQQQRQQGSQAQAGRGDSPLFSDDQGPSSPIPPLLGVPPSEKVSNKGCKNTSPTARKHAGGLAFGSDDTSGMTQEALELKATNLRLRGVVADMRREMERLRDPGPGVDDAWKDGREQQLLSEIQQLRAEISGMRDKSKQQDPVHAGAQRASVEEVPRLQAKCRGLKTDVARLTEERDKLMEIGNSLRAELNRVLSTSYQREDRLGNDGASGPRAELNEAALSKRVDEAIARAQRETRRKYRAKVSEIEVAFAQLTADNRKLRARVGQLTKGRGSEGQMYVAEVLEPGEAFIPEAWSTLDEDGVGSLRGSGGPALSSRSARRIPGEHAFSCSMKGRGSGGDPLRQRLCAGDSGDEAGGLTEGPHDVHRVRHESEGGTTKLSHKPSAAATLREPLWPRATRYSAAQREDGVEGGRARYDKSRSRSDPGWVALDYAQPIELQGHAAMTTERRRGTVSAPADLQRGRGARSDDSSCAMFGDQPMKKKIVPSSTQPRAVSLPSSSSQRQTEGQRAAAQRLRTWQERRKRDQHGENDVRRAVRNYNIKDDGVVM